MADPTETDTSPEDAPAHSAAGPLPDSSQSPPPRAQSAVPELVPARMLNEYAYCPRLAYLEWVQSEFADNYFTEHGRYAHRHVDKAAPGAIPPPEGQHEADGPKAVKSLLLEAPCIGLVAKMDLLEFDDQAAVPVDYKRGKKPDIDQGVYEPERVQLCAQALILREAGYGCSHGFVYFTESKQRVRVDFDDELAHRTLSLLAELRRTAACGQIPPPLEDSPKCPGCSLVSICLPDETNLLRLPPEAAPPTETRRLIAARDDALPVYVQKQGGYVGKSGEQLVVKFKGEKLAEARLFETSQVNIMGHVQISTEAIRELCTRGIPIAYFSTGGWFYGYTQGTLHKNVELRQQQFRAADDPNRCLELARAFTTTKIRNCRTLLRRNTEGLDEEVLKELKRLANLASNAPSVESLLGIEGAAAKMYFQAFPTMLKRGQDDPAMRLHFDGRNRRPPRDPVNALLSLSYAMLTKEMTITLAAVGLEPFLGFYHRPRYGRPSLALDLIEEFRPLVADSTVITAINKGVVTPGDFVGAGDGVALKEGGRRRFIQAYEQRLDQLIRHPLFDYQVSYRRVLNIQARLLGRYLSGEISAYPGFLTR